MQSKYKKKSPSTKWCSWWKFIYVDCIHATFIPLTMRRLNRVQWSRGWCCRFHYNFCCCCCCCPQPQNHVISNIIWIEVISMQTLILLAHSIKTETKAIATWQCQWWQFIAWFCHVALFECKRKITQFFFHCSIKLYSSVIFHSLSPSCLSSVSRKVSIFLIK